MRCVNVKLTVRLGAARCQRSQWGGMPSVAFFNFQVTYHHVREGKDDPINRLFCSVLFWWWI